MIIRNARIVTLDVKNRVFDSGAVQVRADGSIGWVRRDTFANGDEVLDARGKLLMPALINCHTHLYSTLARGMPLHGPPPRNFTEILRRVWWRLDSALKDEDVYYSALVGLIDSAKAGVGTIVDHHSSPNACLGSLGIIERAFRDVGLRGALCYETSDRNGSAAAMEGFYENVRYAERVRRSGDSMLAASFGLHASFTLREDMLRACVDAARALETGCHIHVAEDRADVVHARRQFHKTPVKRLCEVGALNERSIAAHCVHVSSEDVSCLARHGANVIHNPQSNCNNAVGTADISQLLRRSVLVGLGSDGFTPRMWEEFTAAAHVQNLRTRDPRVGGREAYTALLNNRAIAKKAWGWEIGRIAPGARADLMLLDYYPPTPLTSGNLFGHVLFGIAHARVDSLMVNGRFVVRDGHCVTVDENAIAEKARARARELWNRL